VAYQALLTEAEQPVLALLAAKVAVALMDEHCSDLWAM
jgi:hypothetical protein